MNLQRNVQQALPLLILILLVGLTMWLERATRVDDRPSSGKLRHDPDVIVDNFTVRRFDPSGQRSKLLACLPDAEWQFAEVRNAGRWIVYMGRFDNAEQAARKKAELRGLGVSFREITAAGLAPGLALGTYSTEAAARVALQKTERDGVRTAKVAQERAESQSLTVRLPAITEAQRAADPAT